VIRTIGAILAGFGAWLVVASVLGLGLHYGWPGYAAVEQSSAFDTPMRLARLVLGAIATVAAGAAAARIAAPGSKSVMVTGILLLLIFLPIHVQVWNKFPVWYHLLFLGYLAPLAIWGGWLVRRGG